jgi:hypothetical protein
VKDLLFRILHHSGEVPNLCRSFPRSNAQWNIRRQA